jgi:hypothetical protein
VDHNMALSETFAVRSIPSFFVAMPQERGVCRFDSHARFSSQSFVDFYLDCTEGKRGWESGVWSNPLSWLWRPLVRAGYVAEGAHRFMHDSGLSKTHEIGVAGAAIFVFLLAWGFVVYALLGWFCGHMNNALLRRGDESEDEAESDPKKLKKE